MEANDVLADDVEIGRLEFPVTLGIRVRIADARQIVRQRIDPDVHDMAWAAGNGDAPVKARARDRQVRQASSDEAHHFIATAVGLDEIGRASCRGRVCQYVMNSEGAGYLQKKKKEKEIIGGDY